MASSAQLLIVEGNDDRHVVEKLLDRHGLERAFAIEPRNGFESLRESLRNEVNAPGRRVLGVVADANDRPRARWQSLVKRLRESDCKPPDELAPQGSIFGGPRNVQVGVWLMPDNQRPGELEDFVADLVPPADRIWPRARQFIDNIPAEDRLFPPQKTTRAQVHAWLATRPKPRPMGLGITSGDFTHDTPNATAFVAWLSDLFGLSPKE